MKRRIIHCILLLALAGNLFWGYRVFSAENAGKGSGDETIKQIDLLMQVFQLIRKNYVDVEKVSAKELFAGAMEGMLHRLDPHSQYMAPVLAKKFKEESEGHFGGVGITIAKEKEAVKITDIKQGAPGQKAGLQKGDVIVNIDGTPVDVKNRDQLSQRVKGEPGTKVRLGIYRPATKENKDIEIVRENIAIPNVLNPQILPDTTIGYVRLNQFTEHSPELLEKVLRDFEAKGVTGIALDFRGNPGGILKSAVAICSFFLQDGKLVTTVRYHSPTRPNRESENFEELKSKSAYHVSDKVRLAILLDRNSASASEVTAACLRDHGRAMLVGEKSFGKGSVQNVFTLPEGAAVKLTIARYYSPDPKRTTIDHHGIEPDIPVTIPKELILQMLQLPSPDTFLPMKDPVVMAAAEFLKTGKLPETAPAVATAKP